MRDPDAPLTDVERILLRLRESVAQAVERAGRDLLDLGYSTSDIDGLLAVRWQPTGTRRTFANDPRAEEAARRLIDRILDERADKRRISPAS